MSNNDVSTLNVQLDPTYGDFLELDDDGNPIPLDGDKYAISAHEELCFECTLPDCKENSKKCLINIAKSKEK